MSQRKNSHCVGETKRNFITKSVVSEARELRLFYRNPSRCLDGRKAGRQSVWSLLHYRDILRRPGVHSSDRLIQTLVSPHPAGTILAEEVNQLKNVPLGMITYHASSRQAANFHTKVVSSWSFWRRLTSQFEGRQPLLPLLLSGSSLEGKLLHPRSNKTHSVIFHNNTLFFFLFLKTRKLTRSSDMTYP